MPKRNFENPFIQLRIKPEEKKQWFDYAKKYGFSSISGFIKSIIRERIREGNEVYGKATKDEKTDKILEILLEERKLRKESNEIQKRLIDIVQKQFNIVQRLNGKAKLDNKEITQDQINTIVKVLKGHQEASIKYKYDKTHTLKVFSIANRSKLPEDVVIRCLENNKDIFKQVGKGWDLIDEDK